MAKINFTLLLTVILSFATPPDIVWTVRYNGSANLHDNAHDIALDDSENVYVTGASQTFDNINGYDYLTIKYNPSGDTVWTKRNGDIIFYDEAYGIVVDRDSNWVYVTGTNYSSYYYTIKYNLDGDTIWTRLAYPSYSQNVTAQAIDVDRFSNVYITGYYYHYNLATWDCFTVKYDSDGDIIWSDILGSGSSSDYAYDIAVDTLGFIFVTGSSIGGYLTIKYEPTGSYVWIKTYDVGIGAAQGVAVDQTGNIYSTGFVGDGSNWDCLIIKCDSDGDTIWTRKYHNPQDLTTRAYDIAVDSFGNIYIAGVLEDVPSTSHDYLIIKYTPDGDTIWTTTYNSPYNNNDIAYGITVDDSGYIYVSGASMNSANNYDYLTIKYYDNTYAVNENAVNNSIIKPMLFLFPNPTFNQVAIHYNLRKESNVTIKIYDVSGKMIKAIYNGNQKAGVYTKYWNGMITENTKAPCGVYFCQLEADNFNSTAKLILLK